MPKRQSTTRIECDEVQGEGSYVVLRSLPYGLIRQIQAKADDKSISDKEAEEFSMTLFREAVVEWNWVDDNDNPIPIPSDENFNIDELLIPEVVFLTEVITGGLETKNSN